MRIFGFWRSGGIMASKPFKKAEGGFGKGL
jgi:hypothetical protein